MSFNPCCCGWNAEATRPEAGCIGFRRVSILVVVDGTLKLAVAVTPMDFPLIEFQSLLLWMER